MCDSVDQDATDQDAEQWNEHVKEADPEADGGDFFQAEWAEADAEADRKCVKGDDN
ncbi:hypothetical protein GCM10022410_14190 [Amphibacillus indicireducens]|uniref:Uncharacterized protein n=1 Tax=Amphibacillus indicireducens TaxID=1076330 RepID=A0ABP7VKS7_9BACI